MRGGDWANCASTLAWLPLTDRRLSDWSFGGNTPRFIQTNRRFCAFNASCVCPGELHEVLDIFQVGPVFGAPLGPHVPRSHPGLRQRLSEGALGSRAVVVGSAAAGPPGAGLVLIRQLLSAAWSPAYPPACQ